MELDKLGTSELLVSHTHSLPDEKIASLRHTLLQSISCEILEVMKEQNGAELTPLTRGDVVCECSLRLFLSASAG